MLKLVLLEEKYRAQLNDMMEEWLATGEKIVPYAIRAMDYHNFEKYRRFLVYSGGPVPEGLVPATTYFALDTDRDIFVGAVNIRHYLNDSLLLNGGHIGDGIRPSERRKGFGTQMVGLALEKCRDMGMDKVLMVCNKANTASAKTIMKNGGILENEIVVDGTTEQRYWIAL